MKIAVLTAKIPFVFDPEQALTEALARHLGAEGHRVEIISLPLKLAPAERILDAILAVRLLQLWGVDQVIGVGFPAYFVRHGCKVLWLLRQFRQAHEFWGTKDQTIPNTPEGAGIRRAIGEAEHAFLKEARHVFVKSQAAQQRLHRIHGIQADVLYPPLIEPERYRAGEIGDYLVFADGADADQRPGLVIEAMRRTRSGVRLVATVAAGSSEWRDLAAAVDRHALHDRVRLIERPLAPVDRANLFTRALGCIRVPYEDDAVGYSTLESFQSRKPVITCTDSGAPLEIVDSGDTGLVTAPEAGELAEAFDRLMGDRLLVRRLGDAAFARLQAADCAWDRVIRALVL